MDICDVRKRLALIREVKDDFEEAHALEDALHRAVLAAIANGTAAQPSRMAFEVLKSQTISFPRYCACQPRRDEMTLDDALLTTVNLEVAKELRCHAAHVMKQARHEAAAGEIRVAEALERVAMVLNSRAGGLLKDG